MNDQDGVPIIVVTKNQDHLEAVNSTLRNAGHPVHCAWIPELKDMPDALIQINPELVLCFAADLTCGLEHLIAVRNRTAPEVPVVVAREQVDESVIASDMASGAQDVVSLNHRNRLQAVVARELRAFRLERALNATLVSAKEYKQQLQAFMDGSVDAFAHVQEGIVVETNPAWLELFGYPDETAVVGQPLMDLFDPESHAALKGAVVACIQGKWSGHALKTTALCTDGSTISISVDLQQTDFEGEAAVRLCVPRIREAAGEPVKQLDQVLRRDPGTGLFHRQYFLDRLRERLAVPAKGGVRAIALIEPDNFHNLKDAVGPLHSEHILAQFAAFLREQMQPSDLYGRFDGSVFAALLERGTARDLEAWGEHVVRKLARQTFEAVEKSISLTTTIGVATIGNGDEDLDAVFREAQHSQQNGAELGGNRIAVAEDKKDTDTRIQAFDQIWVKQLKSALMENRFKLVQQPIASLTAGHQGMFDVLIRMLDEEGEEVLPSEFLPAAERNGLMKNIDRWVIGAAMSLCAARNPSCLFVRLSKESVSDQSLVSWLKTQLKTTRIEPSRICFQITEEIADQHLKQAKLLLRNLQRLGFNFAIEHFGIGRDSHQIISHLSMNYLKIDGSLMQGIASNQGMQQKVRALVDEAKRRSVPTIAERIEDANTIAVLWQLGVEFMQGYYVHEPEVVLSAPETTGHYRRPKAG